MRRPLLFLTLLCALAVTVLVPTSAGASTATASISGTATYAGADPADLEVQLHRRTASGTFTKAVSTSVAADGRWHLTSVEAGTYRVEVIEPSGDSLPAFWRGTSLETAQDVVLAPASVVTGIDVAVERGGRLAGAVLSSAGNPLAGVQVTLYEHRSGTWEVAARRSTRNQRVFQFSRLRPGTYRLGVDPDPAWERHAQPPVFWPSATSFGAAGDLVVAAGQASLDLELRLPAHRPVVASAPSTLTGTPQVGQTLGVVDARTPVGTTVVSRQWFRSTADDLIVPIDGAATDRLTLTADLVGSEVLAKTTVSLPGFDDTVHWSWPVTVSNGEFSQRPAVTLGARVEAGTTARATISGGWGETPTSVEYRWLLDGKPVPDARESTFALTLDDAGRTLQVVVTARAADRESQISSSTTTEAERTQVLRKRPTLTGVQVGSLARVVTTGSWSPGPGPLDALQWEWFVDGRPVAGADEPTFRITPSHVGRRLHARVTLWARGYATTSATTPVHTVPSQRFVTYRPTIKGTAKPGRTVKVSMRTWAPKPSRVTYQWYASGKAIKGATKSSLKLGKKQAGKKLTVRVTGSRATYTTQTTTSRAVKVRKR